MNRSTLLLFAVAACGCAQTGNITDTRPAVDPRCSEIARLRAQDAQQNGYDAQTQRAIYDEAYGTCRREGRGER